MRRRIDWPVVVLAVLALGSVAYVLAPGLLASTAPPPGDAGAGGREPRALPPREQAPAAGLSDALAALAARQEDANRVLSETLAALAARQAEAEVLGAKVGDLQGELAAGETELGALQEQVAAARKEKEELVAAVAQAQQKAQQRDAKVQAVTTARKKGPAAAADVSVQKGGVNGENAGRPMIGPGPERVEPRQLSAAEVKQRRDASHDKFQFNEYQSSLLPMDREIPDTRVKECLPLEYDVEAMPSMSVIICFVDEAWSALLRTVWSVINRTPQRVLKEVILVDDYSNAHWLHGLGEYVEANFKGLVRIVRAPSRQGLIRARLMGAKAATGTVLTFLDSHCECNQKWAEPILQIIGKEPETVVTPVIDTISHTTLEHASWTSRIPSVGTFDWTMDFNWKSGVHTHPGQTVTDPVDSPTMAGGLFSINRDYFYKIGSYDEEMDGWGGENLEMSFRIWQCHGKLVTAPCSHVGHIFRDKHPYTVPGASIHHTFMKNSMRVAEVWMDEFKEFFYKTRPPGEIDIGDLTKRRALRERLQCKSFKWFMQTLLPDMFIPDKEHISHQGALRGAQNQCLDKMGQKAGGKVGVYYCHGQGGNQFFMQSVNNELRTSDNFCLDGFPAALPASVHMARCHQARGNQEFVFDPATGVFQHPGTSTCLEVLVVGGEHKLKLNKCVPGAENQRWEWQENDTEKA